MKVVDKLKRDEHFVLNQIISVVNTLASTYLAFTVSIFASDTGGH